MTIPEILTSQHLKQKRICFVTTIAGTLKAFVFPQARYLLENGWSVTFICATDNAIAKDLPHGVKYVPMPFKRGMDLLGMPRAIIKLYRYFNQEKFDIVQYSTPNAAFCASTASFFSKVPVRLYAQWGIRYVGFTGLVKLLFKQIEKWCCFCSTIIEPDSYSNLEFSIKEGLYPKNKGRVIWNGSACGVNTQIFNFEKKDEWRSEYRKKLGLTPDNLVIGFIGDFRRDKGFNEIIAACRRIFTDMPSVRLLLRGEKTFYDSIEKDLRDWVDSSEKVIILPRNNEIPQYMACMDIFVFPSYREGFGMVVIEASSMGVPVIVSNIPGPIDAVREGETGIIVPVKNIQALSTALLELLNNPTKRKLYGNAAAKFARDNFGQSVFLEYVLKDKERLLINNEASQR